MKSRGMIEAFVDAVDNEAFFLADIADDIGIRQYEGIGVSNGSWRKYE